MKSKVALTVFLSLVVLVLLFFNMRAILRPAKYQAVYDERVEMNTNRLTVIQMLQDFYHETHGCYAPHIDSLIDFYENGKLRAVSTVRTIPSDSLLDEKFMEKFNNMNSDERQKNGYERSDTTYYPVKNRMKSELEELNSKKDGLQISMQDFYYMPYSKKKYEILVNPSDTVVSRFGIYVPVEEMMVNFRESLPKSFLTNGFYNNMEDVFDPKIPHKDKRIKDLRDIQKFQGLQLGDTTENFTLDIKAYGASK